MKTKQLSKIELIWLVLVSLCLVEAIAILGINISQRNPSYFKNMAKMVFTKQPERLTELYFTDHLNLPKEIELGVPYSFEFTVHNLEHQDFTYVYEVTTEDLTLDQGQFFLRHDKAKTIPVTFSISQPFERIKITVNLVNKNQPIHLWLEQPKHLRGGRL